MNLLKTLNLLIRFLLELGLLAAVGYWGFATQPGWPMQILFGIGLPVLLIVIWGLFVAPRATYRLSGLSYLFVSVILLAVGALALFASGRTVLGWVYAVILAINQVLLSVWNQ